MDKALDISTVRIKSYIQLRLEEGASNGTINRELEALSRMFTLGIQSGIITRRPHIPKLEEAQPRQGFMEHNEYTAIKANLPEHYQDVLDFFYHTGWRKSEIHKLEWQPIDLDAGTIRLEPSRSKNKDGRVLMMDGALLELIRKRWELRVLGCPYVFHRAGERIGGWRKTWQQACSAAGLPGKLLHDFRRTVVRNLIRAGVPDKVAMQMTGHKTRSVFDRYNIVS